jgi:putative transposase
MAQTLFSSYFHIVFSTKNRFPFIDADIEDELYAYIGGILRGFDGRLLKAGGTSNHSHLLTSTGKNRLIPDVIGAVKRDSSKWIKTKGPKYSKFAWQDGYAAFSVGHTQLPAVERYIADQKEGFYRKYGIQFDEEYVWA